MTLSVILPVYNLASEIKKNIAEVESVLRSADIDYELIPVDDGSTDDTASELASVASSRVKPIVLKRNGGKGHALKVGFESCRGEMVMLLDGDLDILPESIPCFLETMEREHADIVIGSKRHPRSKVFYPWHRRLASAVYFGLVRMLIGLPVSDTQTGMKLFRRETLGYALERMLVKEYAFDLELLSIAYGRGAKIVEAPVAIRFGDKFGCLQPLTVKRMLIDSLAVFYRLRLLNYYAHVEIPPPLTENPMVSVVIACPETSWMLEECLNALAKQTYRDFEVIILPDTGDGMVVPSECEPLSVRIIPTGKVRPAEKRNLGIRESRGDIVAFIDDDAYPDQYWIERAVKYFGEPTIGAVGGPGITPPGDGFWAKCGGRVYENLFVSGNYRYRYIGGRVRKDIDDYPSCNLFVRKSVLESFGGYRTDFWPGEDTLLCEDIVRQAKKRIVYDPWSLVYHHRRSLFASHLRQLGRYGFHRGYFVKRFPVTSCRLSYFIPTFFVLYLLALIAVFLCRDLLGGGAFGPIAAIASSPLIFYLVLTAIASFSFNPIVWIVTELGVFLSHVWYGVQFMRGLTASKAPCEFIGKDHAAG